MTVDAPARPDAARRARAIFPPLRWLRGYSLPSLQGDLVAGVTLAAYALPIALAYATLAGLLPQLGVYGCMLDGLGYALLGSSRHLAIGPTSAISFMVAATAASTGPRRSRRFWPRRRAATHDAPPSLTQHLHAAWRTGSFRRSQLPPNPSGRTSPCAS